MVASIGLELSGHLFSVMVAMPSAREHDFGGARLHFVQIGLGTNTTFLQNLGGDWEEYSRNISWLSEALSERRPEFVRGVAVEPVAELAEALKPVADRLPGVFVLQVAIGEEDSTDVDIVGFSRQVCHEKAEQFTPRRQNDFRYHVECLINMSTVHQQHPESASYLDWILNEYGIALPFVTGKVDIWSYDRLSAELRFCGCEVLMVDAEGCDAQIIRSLIVHCRQNPRAWPDIIQFETLGHCDALEGDGTEKKTIQLLEGNGYKLLCNGPKDTYMVRMEAAGSDRLKDWLRTWLCDHCKQHGEFPYVSTYRGRLVCKGCMFSWEKY